MAAYRLVYDSRHLHADCQEPGSAPGPYARQWSMGYLDLFTLYKKILILYNIEWRELSDIAQVGGHILSRLR